MITQDEKILAEIIAGAVRSGRTLQPLWGSSTWGFGPEDLEGPCCAIGMGCLFAGFRRGSPLTFFAEKYGVSRDYAVGVSDGFEGQSGVSSIDRINFKSNDYARGWAVGSAARTWSEL